MGASHVTIFAAITIGRMAYATPLSIKNLRSFPTQEGKNHDQDGGASGGGGDFFPLRVASEGYKNCSGLSFLRANSLTDLNIRLKSPICVFYCLYWLARSPVWSQFLPQLRMLCMRSATMLRYPGRSALVSIQHCSCQCVLG